MISLGRCRGGGPAPNADNFFWKLPPFFRQDHLKNAQILPFEKRKLPQDRPKRLAECFLKLLFAKIFGNICFFNAFSSKLFLQSVFFKALSSKTLRSKPLPSLQSVSPKAFSSKLLFKAPSFKALRSKRSLQSPLPESLFFKASSFKASRSKLPVSPQSVPPKASSSKPLVQSAFPSPFLKALSSKPLLSKPLAQSLSPLPKAFSSKPPPQSPSSKPFLPKPLVQSVLLKAFR